MSDAFSLRWGQSRTRLRPPIQPPWLNEHWLDDEREQMEAGPGGDVDADGRLTRSGRIYVPSLKRTVSVWLRLYEQVHQGKLGGPQDGLLAGPVMQELLDVPSCLVPCPRD